MSSARLLALRLHGFKSFAERTTVEFGAGISAVVGPNGSGKSNLADGLRWALGEQGRALRSRKSEDVIFAGSDKRPALGMADVSLVLDNSDGLLPMDFQALELGRRLYRSGENDYLLNRSRVRLKDLVDLLDAAHLADNAFLFIGQGMVDQALALRPEERRPLFEEVAGVRRHERRRRRAEEQLVEAEANLARVQDILGELRPQARRLAAQAEQQTSRASAGEELAAALVLSAHVRWYAAAELSRSAADRLGRTRADAERATSELAEAEAALTEIGTRIARGASVETEQREAHEVARSALTSLQLAATRQAAELDASRRDRARLEGERSAAEVELAARRRALAAPLPERDVTLAGAVEESERALAEARRELGGLQAARQAEGEERAALQRALAARTAEHEAVRRQLADAARRAADERARADAAAAERVTLEAALAAARDGHRAAIEAELAAAATLDAARAEAVSADGVRQAADERAATAGSTLAAVRGRVASAAARLAEDEARGIARAAVRLGGRRVDGELQVAPAFRAAVEAALGESARGYLVGRATVAELAAERGWLILDRHEGRPAAGGPPGTASSGGRPEEAAFLDRLGAAGGGLLVEAILRDQVGAARSLLERTAWAPDLAAALALQSALPVGWQVVVRDGSAVLGETTVALGRADGSLERRADLERLEAELVHLEAAATAADATALEAARRSEVARRAVEVSRNEEARIGSARRAAEESERVAARALERLAREAAWQHAAAERTEAELARQQAALTALEAAANPSAGPTGERASPTGSPDEASALETWQRRVDELRLRRDRLAAELADRDRVRLAAEAAHAREAAAAAMSQDRIERADREMADLARREAEILLERDRLSVELATATSRAASLGEALAAIRAAEAADRALLVDAELTGSRARDRFRTAEDRLRAAEVGELEARLALDLIREQALGDDRRPRHARAASARTACAAEAPDDDPALDETPARDPRLLGRTGRCRHPPAAARPGAPRPALRRRYHELGAANPMRRSRSTPSCKARLDRLEAQDDDLRSRYRHDPGAHRRARDDDRRPVPDDVPRRSRLAFDARFEQLFGGGFARL